MTGRGGSRWSWLVPLAIVLGSAACGTEVAGDRGIVVPFGDAGRGREALSDYGCRACHVIPGVRGADGLVGPPLTRFGSRAFVAGELPNTPEDLKRWIMDPQEVEPGTAMPDLDVSAIDAESMVAYLEGL